MNAPTESLSSGARVNCEEHILLRLMLIERETEDSILYLSNESERVRGERGDLFDVVVVRRENSEMKKRVVEGLLA